MSIATCDLTTSNIPQLTNTTKYTEATKQKPTNAQNFIDNQLSTLDINGIPIELRKVESSQSSGLKQLQKQAKEKLATVFPVDSKPVYPNDNLLPELQFCDNLRSFIINNHDCFDIKTKTNLEVMFQKYNINELITSTKNSLTDEEIYNINTIKDYYFKSLSLDKETFDLIKNYLNNVEATSNASNRNNNNIIDYKVLSFIIYWENCCELSPVLKYYISRIFMLQSLDINPHVIFELNKQQNESFINTCMQVRSLIGYLEMPPICCDLSSNSYNSQNRYDFLLKSMYTLWVDLFTINNNPSLYITNIEDLKNVESLRDSQFINIAAKYLTSFIHTTSTATLSTTKEIPSIAIDKLYTGDEIEFNNNNKEMNESEYNEKVNEWKLELDNILNANKITKFSTKKINRLEFSRLNKINYLITIGDFSYQIYFDNTVLEVITSPYRTSDKFHITEDNQEKLYTVTELYDKFIFPIAKKIGLKSRGLHKHFDAIALNGNTELLTRLWLTINNHPEIPILLNRVERLENYQYRTTDNKNNDAQEVIQDILKEEILEKVIDLLNSNLQSGSYQSIYGNYDDLSDFAKLLSIVNAFKLTNKMKAISLACINANRPATVDINKEPTSTMEFRFLHAKEGKHVELLTKLIERIIHKSLEDQKQHKPLEIDHNCKDPKDYTMEEASSRFEDFLNELSMSEDEKVEYRQLSKSLNSNEN